MNKTPDKHRYVFQLAAFIKIFFRKLMLSCFLRNFDNSRTWNFFEQPTFWEEKRDESFTILFVFHINFAVLSSFNKIALCQRNSFFLKKTYFSSLSRNVTDSNALSGKFAIFWWWKFSNSENAYLSRCSGTWQVNVKKKTIVLGSWFSSIFIKGQKTKK